MGRKQSQIYLILSFILLLLVGCNANQASDPNQIQKSILDKMSAENNYSFTGQTSLKISKRNIDDVIKFNGFINEKNNMYVNLNIAGIEGMPEEEMKVVSSPEKTMVKYSEEGEWREITKEEESIFTEFKNLGPEYAFNVIGQNTISNEKIEDKDNLKGLLVTIDPDKMKQVVAEQMRLSLEGGTLTDQDIQDMKEKMGLTDQEIADMKDELQKQMEQSKQQIEEMISTMTVKSSYNIYYDPSSFLVKEMVQNTTSNFTMEGEPVTESVIVNLSLTDYGTKKSLPSF